MPSPDQLIVKLQGDMPEADIDVVDLKGSGDHFSVEVTSQQFDGLSRVEQHRLVYGSLQSMLDDGSIHALKIATKTPTQES